MTKPRSPSQPDELLRRWSSQGVPLEAPEHVAQRREIVVDALARSIRGNAEARRNRARRRWIAGLALAAAIPLAFGLSALSAHYRGQSLDRENQTTVSQLQGAVVVIESGESRVLEGGSHLALHALGEIETAPDAQAEIRSAKSVVHLSAATKLTVPQTTSTEERFRLALGHVDVSVDKNSRLARSVVVETPNAEVVVHGTVFAVGVAQGAQHTVTDVSVSRGSVWVIVGGAQVAVLGPGQHWSSEAGLSPDPVILQPRASAPPAPLAVASSLVKPEAPAGVPHAIRGGRHEALTPEAKASVLAEENRQFQEALDARNRGDDAHAAELFSRLVSHYPGYEEAEVELFRTQKRLGQSAAAAAEARRYLALHPQGFAREEARLLALSAAPTQPR